MTEVTCATGRPATRLMTELFPMACFPKKPALGRFRGLLNVSTNAVASESFNPQCVAISWEASWDGRLRRREVGVTEVAHFSKNNLRDCLE